MKKRMIYLGTTIVLLFALGIIARIYLHRDVDTHEQKVVLIQEPVLPIPDLTTDKATISRAILALTTHLLSDNEKFKNRLMLLQSVRKHDLPEKEILDSLKFMADRYEIIYNNDKDAFSDSSLQQLGIIHCFLGNSERGLKMFKQSIDKASLTDRNYHLLLVHKLLQEYNLIDDARELFLLLPKENQDRELYLRSRLLGEPLPTPNASETPTISLEETFATMPPLKSHGNRQREMIFYQLQKIIQKNQLDLADRIVEKLQGDEYGQNFSTYMEEYDWPEYMQQMFVLAQLDYLQGRKNRFEEKKHMLESQLDLWIDAENTRYSQMMKNWSGKKGAPPEKRYLELPILLKLKYIQVFIAANELEVPIQTLKELKNPSTFGYTTWQNEYYTCFDGICDVLIQKKDYARIHELIDDIFGKYDSQLHQFMVYDKLLDIDEKEDAEKWADQAQIPQDHRQHAIFRHAISQNDFEKAIEITKKLDSVGGQINYLFMILNK